MTSGVFHSIPIDSIEVHREARQRKEISRIEDLTDSISRLGLIHPIVVTRDKVLVAGERRLTAAKSLGWTSITCQFVDEVEPRLLAAIELEENIKRKDIPWQDQVNALKRFHDLHHEDDPSWTLEKTGEAIGLDLTTVSHQLAVAKRLDAGDERIINADRFSTARSIVRRDTERKRHDEAVLVKDVVKPKDFVIVADFNDWAKTYDGPPFNFIHCDFPYGIDVGSGGQIATSLGDYDDSFATYEALLATLKANADKLMGTSCHVLFWFSMKHYTFTLAKLQEFLWVDPMPLIWHKDDNSGTLPFPDKSARRVYETAFVCSWGDRPIIQSVSNVFAAPLVRLGSGHMSEKSEAMLRYFLGMFVNEHSRVLDPTAGSGSSLRAALRLGAKSLLGLEVNPEFAKAANELLSTRKR